MKTKRVISIFEMCLMILSTIAFTFLVAQTNIPEVSASDFVPSGCCLETQTGALCQEMPIAESSSCKADLIGTSCSQTNECQKGCCYNSNAGICTLNAPRDKCESSGGNWSSDTSCNIEQCQVGCCLLGNGASMTTTRECTLLAKQYEVEKIFKPLDAQGSCSAYAGLSKEGACLTGSSDFSNERSCTFTTKGKCGGEFKEGYLCTSKELNTECEKTTKTSCFEGKDEVYFIDSCGNRANIYDSSKAKNQEYWEKYIEPSKSCQAQGLGCGNCDYLTGSVCTQYQAGKGMPKPTMGDFVCRNLNCGDKKHGDSWCIYDTEPNKIAPVGSRHFVASCFEGEVSIEGCADFTQEICAQHSESGRVQAKCLINDWRSCLNSNDKESYTEVKQECDKNPQCMMFNDYFGEDNLKRSDGNLFAGFKNVENSKQGAIGDQGKDQNKVLSYCVPRFTPGFQFWTTSSDPITDSSGNKASSANYGGNELEASSICSLGNFFCISEKHRKCTLGGGCNSWFDHDLNWECNINGENANIKGKDLPNLLAALNERCRAIGTCGVTSNINGETNSGNISFSITRMKIDRKGKTKENYETSGYVLPEDYVKSLSVKISPIKKLSDLTRYGGGLSAGDADTAGTIEGEDDGTTPISMKQLAGNLDVGSFEGVGGITRLGGGLLAAGIGKSGGLIGTLNWGTWSYGSGLVVAAGAFIGYWIGAELGGLIAKNQDWSPGKQQSFTNFMGATGAVIGVYTTGVIVYAAPVTNTLAFNPLLWNPVGIIVLIAALIYMVYTAFFDDYKEQEFYMMQYNCNVWQPPKNGNCDVCNDDVRPCSEYRCKSLGSNCHYFNENGEPGYCASLSEIWQAKITPWKEILTEGNRYANIKDFGFEIEGNSKKEVDAWEQLTFGIITDKQAQCKIDVEHKESYEEMSTPMLSVINQDTDKAEGVHHMTVLSPHAESSATTLPIKQGDNEYYIRCRNFAGQTNEAEFAVKVRMSEGPDLTTPQILSVLPEDNSFIKQGANSTRMTLLVDEPAECKYSIEYDYATFSEMPNNMTCLNDPSSGFYGQWPCFTEIGNLTETTKIFVKCKDQPDLVETEFLKRNGETTQSKEITYKICQSGLEISSTNIKNGDVIEIRQAGINLEMQTYGCINSGEAICSYQVGGFGNQFITFLETGERTHNQIFSTLGTGDYQINLKCEDIAGNQATKSINFSVYLDDISPSITRVYRSGDTLIVKTDEDAVCGYKKMNSTEDECNVDFNSASQSFKQLHSLELEQWKEKGGIFAIKCVDGKGNSPASGCSGIFKVPF